MAPAASRCGVTLCKWSGPHAPPSPAPRPRAAENDPAQENAYNVFRNNKTEYSNRVKEQARRYAA